MRTRTAALLLALGAALGLTYSTWTQQATQKPTNFEYNAEGTGNVLTLPFVVYWPFAIGADAGAYEDGGWNFDVAQTFTDRFDSNTRLAHVQFPNAGANWLYRDFPLPTDWTGTLSLRVFWFSTTTTGNVVWQVATACRADGETLNPSFNTANTVTDATQGTTVWENSATISTITTTGCAAGEVLHLKFGRDPANGSDTMAGDAEAFGVEFKYRRAI